jgi:hypothetical protein
MMCPLPIDYPEHVGFRNLLQGGTRVGAVGSNPHSNDANGSRKNRQDYAASEEAGEQRRGG